MRYFTTILCAGALLGASQIASAQGPPDSGFTPYSNEARVPWLPPGAGGGTPQVGQGAAHSNGGGGASGTNNLIYHAGGYLLPGSTIHYIWWGNSSAWPGDAVSGLGALATGLAASTATGFMKDIFPQYMFGATLSAAAGSPASDSSTPPAANPSVSTIGSEVCKLISQNKLPNDPNAVYVVLTSNFPHGANYCAWHSAGTCTATGTTIEFAYVPNTANVSGCNVSWWPTCSATSGSPCITYSAKTNSIANVLSHEFSESITDPHLNAWYDANGEEIGDKCAWQFRSPVSLPNGGGTWQLQMEWNNATAACIQQ